MVAHSRGEWLATPMPALLALGFSSGLPLPLTMGTLSVWLTESGVSKTAIGLFGGIAIAYSFKFMWSPLVDNLRLPVLASMLGRRRGWLLVAQAALAASLVSLGTLNPAATPLLVAAAALLVAVCSATQDIVIDAYRVEMLTPERQALGAAVAVLGYRLGMIASSAGALAVATFGGWHLTYITMAALIGVGTVAMLITGEPARPSAHRPKDLSAWFGEPLRDFITRPAWLAILAFVALYKLPDAFLGIMANPYYLESGYTKLQIAEVAKLYGLIATITGGFAGAYLVRELGLYKTLWIGGVACALGALLFIPLQFAHGHAWLLGLVITLDNLSGGISTTALVAYLSGLCNKQFTATQYALLSSLTAAARSISALPSGWSAETFGWSTFFMLCAALSLPGLLLLVCCRRRAAV